MTPTTSVQDATFFTAANVWRALKSPTSTQNATFRAALNTWLTIANPPIPIPNPVPVISNASFTISAGYGLDAPIGTLVSNVPVSAFVISGDPNGYFAAYPVTMHLRTSETVVVPPGNYNISIAGTNANGTGPAALVNISLQGSVSPPPPVAGWPDAINTGWQPTGIILTPHAGDLIITSNGVYTDMDISGSVFINASNVTLQRCRVVSGGFTVVQIGNASIHPTGVVVQDCEINGKGVSGSSGQNGIWDWGGGGGNKFLRNNVWNCENGIVPGDGDLIQDNYVHDLNSPGSPHYDGIQMDGGANIDIEHNTVINQWGWTSAVMIANDGGACTNIAVNNNRLSGGGFTVYADGHFNSSAMTGISFTNNRMKAGQYGYLDNNGSNPTWSGNVDDVTGAPI